MTVNPIYNALVTAWNSATQPPTGATGTPITGGMSTSQKIAAVNSWQVTGVIPTTIYSTGDQIKNCINYSEFKVLTAQQQDNLFGLCNGSTNLLGGSANTASIADGMILDYFPNHLTISSGTYNNATGVVTLTVSGTVGFGVGGAFTVSSLTGTGAFASLNGVFSSIAPTSGTTITYNAGAGHGAASITGGSVTPPTITALTALAKGIVQSWWNTNGYPNVMTQTDADAAGLS